MKLPRFVIEYANYLVRDIKQCSGMDAYIRAKKIHRINRAVVMCQQGLVSIAETMEYLSKLDD